jgi:hypothetical protein
VGDELFEIVQYYLQMILLYCSFTLDNLHSIAYKPLSCITVLLRNDIAIV